MSKSKDSRCFNICVVGLSGTEKEKGTVGVGKSCLCNRFVHPAADDYYPEHTSILSQMDFSGRVINNDHYLYWGKASKVTGDGLKYLFNVVEQTEFIDDATFLPHKSTVPHNYFKRVASVKLNSAGKLIYICTDQLGLEQDYEQTLMPDGKLSVDGFLVCIDVGDGFQRIQATQMKFIDKLLSSLRRVKKPIILCATKCDVANEDYLKEVHAYSAMKKVSLPLVETSAEKNVNMEFAFLTLAQMIDKVKGKPKIIAFMDAAKQVKDNLDHATLKYDYLLKQFVVDYHDQWKTTKKTLEGQDAHTQLVALRGEKKVHELFRVHVSRLKAEHCEQEKRKYLEHLPKAFDSLLPNVEEIEHLSWSNLPALLQDKQHYSTWFVHLSDASWSESCFLDETRDTRIPFDFVMEYGASAFECHVQKLITLRKKRQLKAEFAEVLKATSQVYPGKTWEDASRLFVDQLCYKQLSDQDRAEVYQEHQRLIITKAKEDYQELLLENSELFVEVDRKEVFHFDKISDITVSLENDPRYEALKHVPAERDALVLKHMFFVHRPTKESCFCKERCIDYQVENVIANMSPRNMSRSLDNLLKLESPEKLSLLIFGDGRLATQVAEAMNRHLYCGKCKVNGKWFKLELSSLDGDVTALNRQLQNPSREFSGCLCVFNSISSLRYISSNLEYLAKSGNEPSGVLPLMLMLTSQKDAVNPNVNLLKQQGQKVANMLQIAFINCPASTKSTWDAQFEEIVSRLTISPAPVARPPRMSMRFEYEPDIRIGMCVMCGDPYNVDLVLTPFLESQFCLNPQSGQNDSLVLEMFLGARRKRIKITVSSYHTATLNRSNVFHGYILVYSAKRRASLSVLISFLSDVMEAIPIQLVAITESNNEFFVDKTTKELLSEGESIADEVGLKFMTVSARSRFHRQTEVFTPFFQRALQSKPSVEEAYQLDPTLDVSTEMLNQSSVFSSSSFSESEEDDTHIGYSPSVEERKLLPTERKTHEPEDVTSGFGQDSDRYRRRMTMNDKMPTDSKLQINKLDRKFIEKLSGPISKSFGKTPPMQWAPLASIDDVNLPEMSGGAKREPISSSRPSLNFSDFDDGNKQEERFLERGSRPSSYKHRLNAFKKYSLENSNKAPSGDSRETLLEPAQGVKVGIDNLAVDFSSDMGIERKQKVFKRFRHRKKKPIYFGRLLKDVVQSEDNPIPLFLEKCVHYIEMKGLDLEGLYRVSGSKADQNLLQEHFEKDNCFSFDSMNVTVHTIAGCMKAFFSALPEPLLPFSVHKQLADVVGGSSLESEMLMGLEKVLTKLPKVNYDVFKYLVAHLYRVCQHRENNKMSEENLSICFWPTLMKPNLTDMASITAMLVNRTPIQPFIMHCPALFYSNEEIPLSVMRPVAISTEDDFEDREVLPATILIRPLPSPPPESSV
uniref:rho GTPase-activating protein 5-like n=1 Tax=Myxine glutinosa TaxID=7769 RepID=UPI00358ECC56